MKSFTRLFVLPLLALSLMPLNSRASETDLAPNPAGFLKHFTVHRENGVLTSITLESKANELNLRLMIDELKKDIEATQGEMRSLTAENLVAELDEVATSDEWPRSHRKHAIQAMEALDKLDTEAAFNDNGFKAVITKFEEELRGSGPFYKVMASPANPTYFYERAVLHAIVQKVLNYAKKTMGNVPILSVVSFVVERAGIMIEQRRTFHQNLMLHYLQTFTPEQLLMTAAEVSLVRSSIYESRIPYMAIWQSRYAKKNWDTFGEMSFGLATQSCDKLLNRSTSRYEKLESRLNYAFQIVTEKGTRKIVNLYDPKYLFAKMGSDAYFFTSPKKVERQRRLIRLTQLGIKFVPVAPFVTNLFLNFTDSMYVNQTKTDGAMYGWFETIGETEALPRLASQALNPLIAIDLQ